MTGRSSNLIGRLCGPTSGFHLEAEVDGAHAIASLGSLFVSGLAGEGTFCMLAAAAAAENNRKRELARLIYNRPWWRRERLLLYIFTAFFTPFFQSELRQKLSLNLVQYKY